MSTRNANDDAWSAVNRTSQAVAALRWLEMLLHGERALVRDRCVPLLLPEGRFPRADMAGVHIPENLHGDIVRIAAWLRDARGEPGAARLRAHVDRLALRTARIDAVLGEYLRDIRQLVIVGAGLDTRAFNLTAAREATVFEVDFPHVLAFKAARLGGLPLACRARSEVACDAAAADLSQRLAEHGFQRGAPTVWLVEGVFVYLDAAQVAAVNASLAALSAVGSRLVATFIGARSPETFSRGMVTRCDDPAALLAPWGWHVHVTHYADIAREFGRDFPPGDDFYLALSAPRAASCTG
ncbi:MAG: SAM-dependent methyltransferase [Gammaproteobacteria bacterium]|nr:SAM-dependent methyltransferase [Gammaproteobacteria bacterium]